MRFRILPLLLAGLTIAACHKPPPAAATGESAAIEVGTVVARSDAVPAFIEVPAAVRPAQRAAISAQLTGPILKMPELGQTAAANEVLVEISSPDAEARLGLVRAQLAEAERAVTRERDLVDRRVSPAESLRAATDALHIARAATAAAEAHLAHTRIFTPFAGIVTAQHKLTGDLATPGSALLVLESTRDFRAEGAIPAENSRTFATGTEILVQTDPKSPPLRGRIEEIAPSDPRTFTRFAKVSFSTSSAFSGQFARLLVPAGQSSAILVPRSTVTTFGQMDRIFVVSDGRASLRLVRIGRTIGDTVEILSGLAPGEAVVVTPSAALRDGSPITIRP
ncbi:MAG: efflux RND transporter periplasmic adaptor subunit [Opitutaceae bacterium]|nr:efflux RND transporter periplasmic adaptor subunit [Opitutaceae bacterium]